MDGSVCRTALLLIPCPYSILGLSCRAVDNNVAHPLFAPSGLQEYPGSGDRPRRVSAMGILSSPSDGLLGPRPPGWGAHPGALGAIVATAICGMLG
jgi:hypothetical protein